MWTTLDSVRRTILQEQLGGMMDIAGIIACIMAGISVLGTAREYIKGSELDMWDIAKPLAIMMLVCMFDTLVLGPVDSMTNIVTGGIVELLDTDTDDYISEWGRTMDVMTVASVLRNEKDYTEELEELADSSAMGRFFGTVWLSVKKTLLNMFNVKAMTFAGIIGGILFLLVKLLKGLCFRIPRMDRTLHPDIHVGATGLYHASNKPVDRADVQRAGHPREH